MSSGNTMPARWIENLHPDSSSSDPLVTTNIDLLSAEILLTLTTFGAHEASRQRLTTLFRGHISTYTSISASVCQLDAAIEVRSREIADSASGVQRLALRMGVLVWERVLQPWDAGEIDERFEMGKLALRDYEVALREIEGEVGVLKRVREVGLLQLAQLRDVGRGWDAELVEAERGVLEAEERLYELWHERNQWLSRA